MEQTGIVCRQVETVALPMHRPAVPLNEGEAHPGLFAGQPTAGKSRGRTALFWSIGGTVLSGIGFIALALFEQYNDSLTELRHDLKHFNETSADFVKKEGLRRFMTRVKGGLKQVETAEAARLQMEHELRASEQDRRDLTHEMQRLRERLAAVEGRQAVTAVVVPAVPPKK